MKRKALVALLGMCAMGFAFAQGGKEDSSSSVKTITFWYENAGPARTPYIEELIRRFEEKNPDIKVVLTGLSNSDAKSKYDVAVAAKQMPDVVGMQCQWLAGYINNGALEPLDSYVEKWDEMKDQNKIVINGVRQMDAKEKLYMLPNTFNYTPTYWGRADLFKEKGLSAPKTWDEFFTAIKTLNDPASGIKGYSIRGGAGGPDQLAEYLYAYSGIEVPFIDGKSTLNDPLHVEALEKLASIYKVYTPESDITNGYKEMVAAFDSGTAAIIQHNLGSYGEHSKAFKPEQFFAFVSPRGKSGKLVASFASNCTGLAMTKSSKNKDAAFKFISFLCSKESQSYFNEIVGQLPLNTTVQEEEWVQKRQHINAVMDALSEDGIVSFPYPLYLPDYASINSKVALPGFQAVLAGKMSAKDMLDSWADAMNKAYDEYHTYVKK